MSIRKSRQSLGWPGARGLTRRDALKLGGTGVAGALVGPGLIAACGGSNQGSANVEAVSGGIANIFLDLDPHVASAVGTIRINDQVFESLYSLSGEGSEKATPALARALPEQVSETVYRIPLREGVRFHNGDTVTARDVVFSFERIADPELGSLFTRYLTFIERIRDVDERTVEVTIDRPTTLLNQRLALVRIMSEKVVSNASKSELANRPIGTGPYQMADVVPKERVTLDAFRGYRDKGRQPFRTISFNLIEDSGARVAALQSNRVAAIEDPAFQDLERIESQENLSAEAVPSYSQTLLLFHCGKPPFNDQRLRQAIHYAIDREQINESVFFGQSDPATAHLPQISPSYQEPSTVYTHDPERARQLLREAGTPDGFDFELQVSNLNWIGPQAPLIKEQLAQVGINATIKLGETEALYGPVLDGTYQAYLAFDDSTTYGTADAHYLFTWSYRGDVPELLLYWDTPGTKAVARKLDEAFYAPDEETREQLYADLLDIVAEEAPIYPVNQRHNPSAWNDQRLPDFVPSRLPGLDFAAAA